MNSILRKIVIGNVSMIALALLFAASVFPAQAQTHPPAFFPYPSTFEINGIVNYGNLLGVQAAAVGDFNGDGKLDIVSLMGGGWEIDVALGNGDGTFEIPILNTFSLPYNTSPYAMAVGDFNGDGKLDVAVWCVYSTNSYNEVIIFLGNGDGTFTYSNTYTAPNVYANPGSNSLFVADFNGDGNLDLAALSPYCGSSNLPCIVIYLGKGDGTFQPAVTYSTVDPGYPLEYNTWGMAVGDLNGDGKPDIAVTESNGIAVLLNNGDGTFKTAAYYTSGLSATGEMGIALGDVNGDNKIDIVSTANNGDLLLFENQGSGTFVAKGSVAQAPGYGYASLVSLADINGDKKLDLVVCDAAGEIWTFYGKGNGTFTAGPIYPVQLWGDGADNVILADFNGDGALDIFKPLEGHSWDGQVILGRGDGTFQTNAAYGWNANGYGTNLVLADFNGDGFPDVAYSGARSSNFTQAGFEVMLGSSHGVLGTPTFVSAINCGWETNWIAAGDVNGDGKADIVAAINYNCGVNEIAVLTGLGTGKFKAPVYYSTGSTANPMEVYLQDLNGDGKPDIVVSNSDGTISILLNKGTTFGTASVISSVAALSPHLNSVAFGDFNGDGKIGIAAASEYPGSYSNVVYVLPGNGDGTFGTPITSTAAEEYVDTNMLSAGDFNQDGKLDLLVTLEGSTGCTGYYGAAAYVVLLGNGDGTFTAGSRVCTGGDYPMYPVITDFNADGKLDAFIPMLENYSMNPYGPALLEGNGNGTFTPLGESEFQWLNGSKAEVFKGGLYVGATSHGAVVADFNGDGMPDIAVLNADNFGIGTGISYVTVLFNNTQPVSVSPIIMSIGSVAVGGSKSETVLLTNNQGTTLTIDSISASGTDASEFTPTSTCGDSLKAGWECTITVKFKPTVVGVQTATLNITDSVGTQTVALTGGVNPKPTVSSLSPGTATAGGSGFTLTVTGTNFISTSVVDWAGSPLATTYVSATEITAAVPAADIAKAGTYKVTVTNPAPGGGISASFNFTVDNPAPTLTKISPSSATHGGPAFTLTVTGTGYVSASVIKWKTAKLPTTYINSTTLTATVPSSDIKAAGTADVTVFNAMPGGGTSAPLTFTIN
ncbi:MAG: FG-GAP-like repeat-containing protein [Candidatus Sulfotelmatobacter sp.]